MKYQSFIFKDWSFDASNKQLTLTYGLDEALTFYETYRFDFDFVGGYDEQLLHRLFENLFFLAGVSYYKTYVPEKFVIEKGRLDQVMADFYAQTYQQGLGEFFYLNDLDPNTPIPFVPTTPHLEPVKTTHPSEGLLVGLGGGKDSLLSIELLKDQPKVATWSVGHRPQLEPLVKVIGSTHFWVERVWDRQLLELNMHDAYNGHVPISAILAAVGCVVAVLTGYSDVVVSNESSANEPSLSYRGVSINHQYSKSLAFETAYQNYLQHSVPGAIQYYSFLRPLSEVRIAELFARHGFEKYASVFSSCNQAFTHTSGHIFWCGECPKCAFTFLALTPFVKRPALEALWHGKNLLLEPSLQSTYRNLLGIDGDKPLDCVGEVKESRAAMRLAQKLYPELAIYEFDIPRDYDYKALSPHAMPEALFEVLRRALR